MLGLTWEGVKGFIDAKFGTDIASGIFILRASTMTLKAETVSKDGTRLPFAVDVDAGQADALRLMVRKFYERERPDAIDAASIDVDWTKGAAVSIIYFTKGDQHLKYVERHSF